MGIEVLIPVLLVLIVGAISLVIYMTYAGYIARSVAAGLCVVLLLFSGVVSWFVYSSKKEAAIRQQNIMQNGLQQDMLGRLPKQAQSAGVAPTGKKESAIIVTAAIKNRPKDVLAQAIKQRVTIDKLFFVDTMQITGVDMYVFSCNPSGKLSIDGDVLYFCKPATKEVENSFAQLTRGVPVLLTVEFADIREVSEHRGYPVYGAMLMVFGISGY